MTSSLQVMKFGGTSVGDASCIRRAALIVQSAATAGSVVVVVSAMSGVTNRLIEAAHLAEAGKGDTLARLIADLGAQHRTALNALVTDPRQIAEIEIHFENVLGELDRLLQGTALLRELTPRVLDSISGMGERLSAPLVSGAVAALGSEERRRFGHRSYRHRSAPRPCRTLDAPHNRTRRGAPASSAESRHRPCDHRLYWRIG